MLYQAEPLPDAQFSPADSGLNAASPVSYTHLDVYKRQVVATVTGLSGLAAGLVGAVFTVAVGILVDRFSYGPAFLVAGLMPLFATASILLLIRAPRTEV